MSNPYESPQQLSPADEKMWATLVHIGGIFFSFVPALIGYLVLKDRGPFIREHTRSALNFQITMVLASFIGAITTIILIGFLILFAGVGADRDLQHPCRGRRQSRGALPVPADDPVHQVAALGE